MVKKMLEVVVKYLYPAFTKVKILAFTVYSGLSRVCSPSSLWPISAPPGTWNTLWLLSRGTGWGSSRDPVKCGTPGGTPDTCCDAQLQT